MRRVLIMLAASSFCLPLWAWTYDFSDDGITGTLTRESSTVMRTECRMQVDRAPQVILAALTDYDHVGDWLPSTREYKVISRDGVNARFYRKNSTPFFLPEMWATVDARVTSTEGGRSRVEWHRVEGSITVFDASFDIEPSGTGSLVTYRVRTAVPDIPAPSFIIKRAGASAIMDTLRGLRKAARARPLTPPP